MGLAQSLSSLSAFALVSLQRCAHLRAVRDRARTMAVWADCTQRARGSILGTLHDSVSATVLWSVLELGSEWLAVGHQRVFLSWSPEFLLFFASAARRGTCRPVVRVVQVVVRRHPTRHAAGTPETPTGRKSAISAGAAQCWGPLGCLCCCEGEVIVCCVRGARSSLKSVESAILSRCCCVRARFSTIPHVDAVAIGFHRRVGSEARTHTEPPSAPRLHPGPARRAA